MAVNAGTIYSQMVLDNKQYMRSMKAAHGQLKAFESQVNRSSQLFTASMSKLDKQYRLWELNTNSISKALFGKSKQTELTREKMELLEREIEATSGALNEARSLYGESSVEAKQLENSLLDLKIQHAELNKSMEQFSLPNTLKRAGSQMEAFGRSMFLKVTLPITGAGAAAVKSTALFDDRMAAVRAVTGATSEQFQMLRTRAREMGRDTRFSASEAAEGMENLARAGFDVDQIYETIPHMLNLASAGQLELADAASITANMINAFGLEAEDAEHVTGVLAKAAADADTDIYGLGEAMTYLAPTAHDFGWSIEEASAAIMVLSDAGLKGGRAGAVFSSSLSKLTKPTDEAAELMEELNLEFFDANGAMKPLPAVVAELEQGLSGMTDKQKSATLATLFGSRAQKHWSILLNEGSDSLEEMTGVLEESTDEARRQSDVMENTFAGAWREFKSAIGEVAIVIGDIVTPKLRELAEWLRDVAVRFSELDPNMQRNIVKILGLIAAIGPLLMIGGRLFRGVGNLMDGFNNLRGFLGGPLTITIMAIAALALIVIRYWEPISEFFKGLWEGIKETTSSIWQGIKSHFTRVFNYINRSKLAECNVLYERLHS